MCEQAVSLNYHNVIKLVWIWATKQEQNVKRSPKKSKKSKKLKDPQNIEILAKVTNITADKMMTPITKKHF